MPRSGYAAVVLAAGEGKRMRSALPKVLHPLAGRPLVFHVVALARSRRCNPIVVVLGRGADEVQAYLEGAFPDAPLVFARQERQRGTGDAVRVGLEALGRRGGKVLILYGDVPLLRPATIARLERACRARPLALLTAELPDPTGYGRVLREGGNVARIVEDRDATARERRVHEINAGVYLAENALLVEVLGRLRSDNAQNEVYLTDIVPHAAARGGAVGVRVADPEEVLGVNSRLELARAESIVQGRLVRRQMEKGVTFRAPESVSIGVDTRLGRDVVIGHGVQLRGKVRVGAGTRIEGPTVLEDVEVGPGVVIESFCHLVQARIGKGARIGPFARLRPGARVDEEVRIGNFVEVKKTRLRRGAKANHLSYLGDAEIGPGANIGAGTITCNYDGGPVKHRTRIEEGGFIGSNSTLVAPIRIGKGAYVAAGSTLTKDVPNDALAFGRSRQTNRPEYALRLRERLEKKRKD